MALLHALLIFRLQPDGFTNRDLRDLTGQLLGTPMTAGQTTYDLRRLRTHGLISRVPHTHRYHLTDTGRHNALFLTRGAEPPTPPSDGPPASARTVAASATAGPLSGPLRSLCCPGRSLAATRRELDAAGRLESALGQVAMVLATHIDSTTTATVRSLAALCKVHREVMAEAERTLPVRSKEGDVLERIRARREARRVE